MSSPLGRPIRVGLFEHDPDAFHCFRVLPKKSCRKPGAEIDIIRMVMDILGWDWVVIDTAREYGVNNDFGNIQPDGNFSGIMGLLANDTIDMGGLSMRITPDRMKAAHFTFPIRYFQQVYIINNPPENDFRNFIFSPFTTELWALILATILGVALFRFLCSLVIHGFRYRRVDRLTGSLLETYGVMLKQRFTDATTLSVMILEGVLITCMLAVRGNYQSVMNSKLTAPPTSAVPFYHQSELLDLLEKKERFPTYYTNTTLEGSNDENQRRINEIFKYNPVHTHDDQEGILADLKRGGVFYSTYDLELIPSAVSSWNRAEGLTVIRDTTGIVSYVAYGFSISNRKLCRQFNEVLLTILPGVPQITKAPYYADVKEPEDNSIIVKKTPLSLKRHLEQLFAIFVGMSGFCFIFFVAEFIFYHIDKAFKARRYALEPTHEQRSSIDLSLFQ